MSYKGVHETLTKARITMFNLDHSVNVAVVLWYYIVNFVQVNCDE